MTETLAEISYQFQRKRQWIIDLYERVTGLSYYPYEVVNPESYYLKNLGEKP